MSTTTVAAPSAASLDEKEIREIFNRFDSNGDGKISTKELESVLRALGSCPTDLDLQQMIAAVDTDNDGSINLDEFASFFSGRAEDGSGSRKRDGGDDLKDAFDMYDLNGDGKISAEELLQVLHKLGENCSLKDCRRMICNVDSDGDGKVDFEEFKKMMTAGRAASTQ